MAKNNFYVVWHGRKQGIYASWKQCEEQVKGFRGALFMGFHTYEDAEYAYDLGYQAFMKEKEEGEARFNGLF